MKYQNPRTDPSTDAAEGGHAPDNPYNDVPKALEAATTIYDLIPDQPCCSSGLDRSTVQSDLETAFSFHDPDDDSRAANMQRLIHRRFGIWATYHP